MAVKPSSVMLSEVEASKEILPLTSFGQNDVKKIAVMLSEVEASL